MLTVKELQPRIFEVTLSGLVTAADVDTMKRDLTPALEADGQMGMVVRIEALEDITGDALITDARFEFGMLPQWSKLGRVAVVTDKQAVEALLNWIDPILPMIEFRTFAPAEIAAAESWAADLPKSGMTPGPGLRVVEDGSDGLLVFEIDGKMTREGADAVFAAFDRAVRRNSKVDLLVRVRNYRGFDLSLLGDRDTMRSKFAAIGKVGRYAIVGGPAWLRAVAQALEPIMPLEIRTFDAADDDEAVEWARAAPHPQKAAKSRP